MAETGVRYTDLTEAEVAGGERVLGFQGVGTSGTDVQLRLGAAAGRDVGIAAGTVAAGDHGHAGYQAQTVTLDLLGALTGVGLVRLLGTAGADLVTLGSHGAEILASPSAATTRTLLGLGTAATADTGTTAGSVVVLAPDGALPALDGRRLFGLPPVFSAVAAGGGTVVASDTAASLTLVAGSNIVISSDTTAASITISASGSASGEANTASNVGTGGVGLFKQKTLVDLEFKTVAAGSARVSVSDDAANSAVAIDVVEAALTLDNLGGTLGVAKGGTGATTAADARTALGLGTAATTAATDYATAAQGATADTALQPAAIGTTVQAHDADTAKTDVAQAWTAAQRSVVTVLADGATITPDFAVSNDFSVTLGGNRTLANPSNLVAGQSGVIAIAQDLTGSRLLTWGSYWDFEGGSAPTLSTAASAVDVVSYWVRSATSIVAVLSVKGAA